MPHTGSLRYLDDAPKIPAAAVAAEDADLIAYLAAQGNVRMHLTLTPQTLPDATSYNVVADIKGSEHPEQIVIVSGHLDSWDLGTGAIDDGAGVAVAMQTANLIKQLKLRPKRTIRVIAWMNEENGLRGGITYAQDHKAELANHIAAIESDLGAGHPLGFSAHASNKAIEMLTPLSAILQTSGAGIVRQSQRRGRSRCLTARRGRRAYARSDSGCAHLLLLSPHSRRHSGQDSPARACGKRCGDGRACLRDCQSAGAAAALSKQLRIKNYELRITLQFLDSYNS